MTAQQIIRNGKKKQPMALYSPDVQFMPSGILYIRNVDIVPNGGSCMDVRQDSDVSIFAFQKDYSRNNVK